MRSHQRTRDHRTMKRSPQTRMKIRHVRSLSQTPLLPRGSYRLSCFSPALRSPSRTCTLADEDEEGDAPEDEDGEGDDAGEDDDEEGGADEEEDE
jgi:hypothetical protein